MDTVCPKCKKPLNQCTCDAESDDDDWEDDEDLMEVFIEIDSN